MDFLSTESGACFAVGRPAGALYELMDGFREVWKTLNAEPVWLPTLCRSRDDHPLAVGSEHRDGTLCYAACLPLFENLRSGHPQVYGGFAVVHRFEPLRDLEPETRLEAFTVAETVIVGDEAFCEVMYSEVKAKITSFVREILPDPTWTPSRDAFVVGLRGKEELIVRVGSSRITVASGNDHGCLFMSRNSLDGESRCFGLGLERVRLASKTLAGEVGS